MKLTQQELDIMIEKHNLYLNYKEGGEKLTLINQDLQGLNFKEKDISCADLTGSDFTLANLERADLSHSKLIGARFTKAKMRGADLEYIYGEDASFIDANMQSAKLDQANLKNADFSFADLECADFKYTNLENVDFSNADLSESNLCYANMRNVKLRLTNLLRASMDRIEHQTIITCSVSLSFADFNTISYWADQDLWVSPIGEGDLDLIKDRLDELKDCLDYDKAGSGTKLKERYEHAIKYIQEEAAYLQKQR